MIIVAGEIERFDPSFRTDDPLKTAFWRPLKYTKQKHGEPNAYDAVFEKPNNNQILKW